MNIKFLYDFPYVKEILQFFLIPACIIIIICNIILAFYTRKGAKDIRYKYKANVFSIIISIMFTVVFMSALIGFSYALNKQMIKWGLKTVIANLVYISPLIPFLVLISLFIKLIKVRKRKPPMEIDTLDEEDNDSFKKPASQEEIEIL